MSKTFAELPLRPETIEALHSHGFIAPFAIQEMVLPIALSDGDVIGQAKTGTGKTLAFGVPVIERVIAPNDTEWAEFDHKGMPQVLIVVPTRELCTQVTKDIEELASNRGIRTLAVYGGRAFEPQIEALQAGIEIVVGTPGRLLDLSRQGQLRLKQVSRLVLDEADEMLDLGFLPDVEKILANTPNRMQTMLFSATMPGDIIALARRFMNQPIHIRTQDSEDEGAVVTRIKQHVLRAHAMDKIEMLARILQAEGRGPTMVFCRTKRTCQKTAEDLMERGFKAAPIHGDLGQSAREKALGDFKAGKSDVLVATDVAARGIDIDGITHVINYQCPEDEKTYVHRIGRTARAGAHGIAVTFVDWDELARWKMINQVLDLGLAEPEETYSSSPHLYEVLDIPAGSTGRITKSKPVIQQKATPEKRVDKKVESKPKVERTRTRTKKFKES
ncbi:MAG: DEAD/DEAH box helicase [Actinobacteria bacterium]|nr:DEAD/DEAH box helicase [Actinomycetota bacterium]NCV41636.1 DEAD/DEAH box helicase [Actinomycetota bacterium]NCV82046.1 DEAD/DEAH box helicase [Actinomycetota bacterium]NCW42919.1 DEAD/DEAH box helicase [Actinomycetota bacterium]NCW71607.1 DEAD/DEAH box helicase [Actinomycetota bacterium]